MSSELSLSLANYISSIEERDEAFKGCDYSRDWYCYDEIKRAERAEEDFLNCLVEALLPKLESELVIKLKGFPKTGMP